MISDMGVKTTERINLKSDKKNQVEEEEYECETCSANLYVSFVSFLFFCLSLCLSVILYFCLSVFLFVCMSFCLSVFLSTCLFAYLYFCQSVFLSVCFFCLSVFLSIYLVVHLYFCLSDFLSKCIFLALTTCCSKCIRYVMNNL